MPGRTAVVVSAVPTANPVVDPAVQQAMQQAMQDLRAGRTAAALTTLKAVVQRRPADHDAAQTLAMVLMQTGQPDEALALLQRCVTAQPNVVAYRNNLASALLQHGRSGEAAAHWQEVVRLQPGYVMAWLGLAAAHLNLRNAQAAIDAAQRGLQLRPGGPQLTRQLVLALLAADRLDEALALAERALLANPQQPDLRSHHLLMLNYTSRPAAQVAEQHRAFGRHHGGTATPAPLSAARAPLGQRPLRVGLLSADLRTHSVAYFVEALLRHTPTSAPAAASVTVFSLQDTPGDPMTQRLRPLAGAWHAVGTADDAALDRAIRGERIDVLVELQGHAGANRLPALASKPAPVIVSAIGYPNTTGHPAVDWRLVDAITDPPGTETLGTERLLRLDPCFLCYTPPADAPEPALPPADAPFTFGSFNALAKIGDATIALWARVLQAVPGARLLLKTQALADPAACSHLTERLVRGGIAADRVELLPGPATVAEHLALYARLHVALDTVPYNGTTTTCEALWMGVPVLCLEGDRHAARVGASLLSAVGRQDLLASTPDAFVQRAQSLAAEPPSLQARLALRDTMRRSPLMDGAAYAERFFTALRGVYETNDPTPDASQPATRLTGTTTP